MMLKTLTFAALHFTTAFSVTYVLTGSIGVSGAVALVEPLINTVVFYSGLTKTSTALPLSLIHISERAGKADRSRMPSSA